jgi:hypothetical protein
MLLADLGSYARFFGPWDLRSLKLHFACEHLDVATKQRPTHLSYTPDAIKPSALLLKIEAKKHDKYIQRQNRES